MSKFVAENNDVIEKAVRITNKVTGDVYTLEFSRASVLFAQQRNFDPSDIGNKSLIAVPDLLYYAMRMHHAGMSREKVDRLFEDLFPDGIPFTLIKRLVNLYDQAATSRVILEGEEDGKNVDTIVE